MGYCSFLGAGRSALTMPRRGHVRSRVALLNCSCADQLVPKPRPPSCNEGPQDRSAISSHPVGRGLGSSRPVFSIAVSGKPTCLYTPVETGVLRLLFVMHLGERFSALDYGLHARHLPILLQALAIGFSGSSDMAMLERMHHMHSFALYLEIPPCSTLPYL